MQEDRADDEEERYGDVGYRASCTAYRQAGLTLDPILPRPAENADLLSCDPRKPAVATRNGLFDEAVLCLGLVLRPYPLPRCDRFGR